MAAPTPVSSLLHAACYVTAGVYLAARMHSLCTWPELWGASVMWVGTITMVVGVMYAMVQTDLKRMLAFSTISQIGYMIMGLGIGTSLAITAALLHCLNHGFFKGGLFLEAGAVQHAAGTRDMNELGGLAQRMPRTTLCWLIGMGNMAGIPLMSGFVSKWMLYAAALQAGWIIPAMAAWIVSLGTVFLCAKATSAVFLGPLTEKTQDAHEVPITMQCAMGLMAAGSVVLGVAPQLAVNHFLTPILTALSLGAGVQMTWLGLFTGAGSFSTTGGLVLALVSLLLGGVIYALAYSPRQIVLTAGSTTGAALAGGGIFTGGEPLSDHARLTARDFSRIFEQNWITFFRWSNVDRGYLAIWRGLQTVSRALSTFISWMERHATALTLILAALVLFISRFIAPGMTRIETVGMSPTPLLLIAACAMAAFALIALAFALPDYRGLVPVMFLIAIFVVAALCVNVSWLRFGLLETGALLTIPLVWITAKTRSAKTTYVIVVILSGFCLATSELLEGRGEGNWVGAFLLTSVCIKLAAAPLLFWLLRLAWISTAKS